MNRSSPTRTKEAKTGQKSHFFLPFFGFCRSLLAERTAALNMRGCFGGLKYVQITDFAKIIDMYIIYLLLTKQLVKPIVVFFCPLPSLWQKKR
jgi:hypothetical protein